MLARPLLRAATPRAARPLLVIPARTLALASRRLSSRAAGAPLASTVLRRSHARFNSATPSSSASSAANTASTSVPKSDTLPPDASVSDRLKFLFRKYGWYALGVYVVFSTIDFGIAFAAINLVGAERVSKAVAAVREWATSFVSAPPTPAERDEIDGAQEQATAASNQGGREGLYAMLVLAYTIHKTVFLPFRVGLTAAFTPKFVGWLGKRGWAGAQGTRNAAREMRDKMRRK